MTEVAYEQREVEPQVAAMLRRGGVTLRHTAGLLAMVLLAVAAAAPLIWTGGAGSAERAWTSFLVSRIRIGDLPLWNPYQQLGLPVLADGAALAGSFLHLAMDASWAWPAAAAARLALAGLGVWLLAGRYGLAAMARLLAGATYMLGGLCLLDLTSPALFLVAMLPWAALAVEWLAVRVSFLRLAGAAAIFGAVFLGGHAAATAAVLLLCSWLAAVRLARSGPWHALCAGMAIALALLIGAAMGGVVWLPHLHYLSGAGGLLAAVASPRPWPLGMGTALSPAVVGAVALVVGLALSDWRSPSVRGWATIGGGCLLVTAAWWSIVSCVPSLTWLGIGQLHLLLAGPVLAAAMLGGLASQRLRQVDPELVVRRLWIATLALVGLASAATVLLLILRPAGLTLGDGLRLWAVPLAVFLAAALPRPGWWIALIALESICLAALAGMGRTQKPSADVTAAIDFLRSQPAPFRIAAADGLLPPGAAMGHGLEHVQGSVPVSRRVSPLLSQAGLLRAGPPTTTPASAVLNLRYYLGRRGDPSPAAPWRQVYPATNRSEVAVVVYENPAAMPRVWMVALAERCPSAEAAAARLQDNGFDPARTVPVDEGLDRTARDLIEYPPPASPHRATWWQRRGPAATQPSPVYYPDSPDRFRVRVDGTGWLVVADAYSPGWRALFNPDPSPGMPPAFGRPRYRPPPRLAADLPQRPIVPAYGGLRAVFVDGPGELIFEYRPSALRHGAFLSAGGLISLLLLLSAGIFSAGRARGRP